MNPSVDIKRIGIYLAWAFGLAWALALMIYLTGGLTNSPVLLATPRVTLAVVLLAGGYMFAPTAAHILTRLITREGSQALYVWPRIRRGWPYWLAAWVVPGLATIAGAALFFLVQPQYFDPALGMLRSTMEQQLAAAGQIAPAWSNSALWSIVAIQTVAAVLISPLVNGLFTFGEEFGWRAYLQPKLMPLGARKAMLLMGVIWGVWHWPVIAMGQNYGLAYPGAPWLGMLAMVWFTFVIGVFLGWAAWRGQSVWPAVIGHAAINGISALGAVCVLGQPNPLLGPAPVGLIGSAGWTLLAGLLLVWPRTFAAPRPEAPRPTLAGASTLPTPARAPDERGQIEQSKFV